MAGTPVSVEEQRRKRRTTLPEECEPPKGLHKFYVRLFAKYDNRRREVTIDHLSDEELAWIMRTVTREARRRVAS